MRCEAPLRHTRRDPLTLPLALHLAALILFALGIGMTMLTVSAAGQYRYASLLSGPEGLDEHGMWALSAIVLITTVLAPLARVIGTVFVLSCLRLARPPRVCRGIFAWVEHLRPWSMVEIYLLGVFVAYVRLSDMVIIVLGVALYALGALMVTGIVADQMLDRQAVWEALAHWPPRDPARAHPAIALGKKLERMGCDTCGLVSRAREGDSCPRCGAGLRGRRPHGVGRSWAFAIAAVIVYVPANLYPVLTLTHLGVGHPSTIMGGVVELAEVGMWPLAALVFFASVLVPVLKLAGLGFVLVTTQMGIAEYRKERVSLFHVVDSVGRWSMIDIFMVSILVSLLQFGSVVTVVPGMGALAFSSVVILTMLAAHSFDPRLIWDRARAVSP